MRSKKNLDDNKLNQLSLDEQEPLESYEKISLFKDNTESNSDIDLFNELLIKKEK